MRIKNKNSKSVYVTVADAKTRRSKTMTVEAASRDAVFRAIRQMFEKPTADHADHSAAQS